MKFCESGCFSFGEAILNQKISIKTNDKSIGESSVTVKVNVGRPLTKGEIEMCQGIFRDSIDYSVVRIVKAIHKTQVGRTRPAVISDPRKPCIYFPPKYDNDPRNSHYYQDDFFTPAGNQSQVRDAKILFMHEMTHIWQRMRWRNYSLEQPSVLEADAGAWYYDKIEKKEKLDLYYLPWKDANSPRVFSQYNHEQQAEIVANYYDIEFLKTPGIPLKKVKYVRDAISSLLVNPSNWNLLPFNANINIFGKD